MTKTRVFEGLMLSIAFLACAAQAGAAEPDPKAASESKERYARGLHLFENGDNAGALVEFEHAQELVPSRLQLYRIAMVYVAMDKPVDALDSLDEVLSAPGPLKPEYLARAKAAKVEQQGRIGELEIAVNVPATIEIDGARAGKAPLEESLSVAAGEHMVVVVAPGYIPVRKLVTVAAKGHAEFAFELQPTEAKLARVTVSCPLPEAEVWVDHELVGKTPIAEPVAVLPGERVFELKRPGYKSVRRVLNLGAGVYNTVAFDPDEDKSAEAERGQIRVSAGAGDVEVTINGRSRGNYRQPIVLPAGTHLVKLERADFEPLERVTEVTADGETEIKVTFRPAGKTHETRVAKAHGYYVGAAVTLALGGLFTGGFLPLAIWSNGKLSPLERTLTEVQRDSAPGGGGSCDPSPGLNPLLKGLCDQRLGDAQEKVDKYSNLRLVGILGSVGGVALLGVGVTLLILAPSDPWRENGDKRLAGSWVPVFSAGPNGASLGLRGQF